MRRVFSLMLLVTLVFSISELYAQKKYERKSISYLNALWTATPQAKAVTADQLDYMLSTVQEYIEMERFDYNPLPDALIEDFVSAANCQDSVSVEGLAALMEKHLVPRIVEILELSIQNRGQELVSDAWQQSSLVTKLKTSGITLEQIEKVMNAAYLYLPVLTGYTKTKEKDSDKYTYSIQGGIIWFHVNMSGKKPSVVLKVKKITKSLGFGSDQHAYQSAVRNFARNLKVATQEISDFKLQAQIAEVDGGNITFNLGTKEGLGKDECYLVGEWTLNKKGAAKLKTDGWVRVGKVADNKTDKNARSTAWAVKKGSWGPGMTVIEHPRLGIDVAVKAGMYQTKLAEGGFIDDAYGHSILLGIKETDAFALGFDLDAQYNLAKATKISQLFFLIGAHLSTLSIEFDTDNNLVDDPTPLILGFQGGFLKRYYFGAAAISFDLRAAWRGISLSGTDAIDVKYGLSASSFGGQFNMNLEYAFTPDINVGLMAGYKFFAATKEWTASSDGTEFSLLQTTQPEVDFSGLVLGLYVHYSAPSLPFDPIDMAKGLMGK